MSKPHLYVFPDPELLNDELIVVEFVGEFDGVAVIDGADGPDAPNAATATTTPSTPSKTATAAVLRAALCGINRPISLTQSLSVSVNK